MKQNALAGPANYRLPFSNLTMSAKKISLLVIGIASATMIFAQQAKEEGSSVGRNSFFAELGGPGLLFSANIDHRFKNTRLGWGGRAGLGFVNSSVDEYDPTTGYVYRDVTVVTVPLQINYIFGKGTNPHTFETGAGITILSKGVDLFNESQGSRSSVLGTFSFMYRRQPADGGFTWRIGFVPIIGDGFIQPSAGVGVGYSF
jgi:hypothetical protein